MQTINRTFLIWLFIVGLVEGTSTLALFLIAMPLKYHFDMPMAVTIVGMVHGVLFMLLVALFIIGKKVVPLSTGLMWAGIIGAIVPLGPFVVDVLLARMLKGAKASDT